MASPLTPVSTADYPSEDPLSSSVARLLPEAKNYADDRDVITIIREEIGPLLYQTRLDRETLDYEWSEIREMEMMRHNWGSRYKGRSDAYLPIHAKALDTNAAMLSRGLFPSDEYMDVRDESGDTATADLVKTYMRWELEKVARVRSAFKPFFRALSSYGNAPIKVIYNKCARYVGKVKKVGPESYSQFVPEPNLDGLYVSARNPLNVYVYPVTADNLAEAYAIFEDIAVNRNFIMEQGKAGYWKNTEEALTASDMSPPQFWQNRLWQTLDQGNNMNSPPNSLVNKRYTGEKVITEIWMNINLPKSAYLAEEDPSQPIPAHIVMCGSVILKVCRNPYFHQRPPYLYGRLNTQPGFFYGSGIGRRIRPLQYLINDFMNQSNDCGSYGLNPIALINENAITGPLPSLFPGVKINTNDPNNAVKFITPPTELYQMGSMIVKDLVAMAMDQAGAPPVLQGAKSADTATATSILQKNAAGPLQDIVEDIETDIMVPLLQMAWSNAQQFRDKKVMLSVAGSTVEVSPQDLDIDAKFHWLASNQAMNAQQRAQQMIQFLQLLTPPAIQQLQTEGYSINTEAIYEKIWTEAFGFRNFKNFVTKQAAPGAVPPGMGGPPSGPPQGQPPSGGAGEVGQGGDRVRSPLEQVTGADNAAPLAPGDGEEFMNTRANADDLAGMLGSLK